MTQLEELGHSPQRLKTSDSNIFPQLPISVKEELFGIRIVLPAKLSLRCITIRLGNVYAQHLVIKQLRDDECPTKVNRTMHVLRALAPHDMRTCVWRVSHVRVAARCTCTRTQQHARTRTRTRNHPHTYTCQNKPVCICLSIHMHAHVYDFQTCVSHWLG